MPSLTRLPTHLLTHSIGESGIYEYSLTATKRVLNAEIDPKMEQQNLGINLLYWTSFVQMDKEMSGNANRFKLNADPAVSVRVFTFLLIH